MIVNLCKYSNYKYVYFCILWHLKAFLDPKTSSQRFQEFKFKSILRACKFVCMLAWFVGPKTISRPESFITEVVGDDNSFEMVCFNVISYVSDMALFSTHFANISKLMSIGTSVLTFQHHWIHLVVKFLKVPWIVSRNGQCSIFSKIVDISVECLPVNSSFWNFCWWECWRQRLFNFFICLPYQTLQLEFFSNIQYERIQTLLENICFPMIKVHNGQEIFRLQPSFYKLVGEGACSFQAASGKETGSSQDHLVCFHLLTILTGQSHISKVVVLSKASNALLMFSWKLFHWRHSFSDMPMLQSLRVYMNSSKRAKYRARAKITGQK